MPVTLATQSRDTGDGDAPRSLHKSTCLYTSALLCKTQRKQNQLTWLPFKATSGSFSAIRLFFSPPTEKKKQVSKPVPSIKQQLPLASEACGCQHEAFQQYLWLNGGCRAAPQAPSSSLYSFRVPLQSADPLWCGSTRTDFDSNHCPLIVLTCLIGAPLKRPTGSCATKSRPLKSHRLPKCMLFLLNVALAQHKWQVCIWNARASLL